MAAAVDRRSLLWGASASAILVNEMKADPQQAYFVYLWKLLLDHPL